MHIKNNNKEGREQYTINLLLKLLTAPDALRLALAT